MRGKMPGELERVVLLALAGFDGEATGRQVYDAVTEASGREVSVAAIHLTLNRVAEKGWARCRTTDPPPHEGGKPRRHYALASEGAAVVAQQRAEAEALWRRAAGHPLLGGES